MNIITTKPVYMLYLSRDNYCRGRWINLAHVTEVIDLTKDNNPICRIRFAEEAVMRFDGKQAQAILDECKKLSA